MNSQCIACGSDSVFYEHLCQQCFLESNPIIQNDAPFSIVVCMRCELLSARDHWTTFYLADIGSTPVNQWLSTLVSSKWTFYYRPTAIHTREVQLAYEDDDFPVTINGILDIHARPDAFTPLLTMSKDLVVNIDWGECTECRTRMDGQYQSKIQIRSTLKIDSHHLEMWEKEIITLSEGYLLSDGKNPLLRIEHLKNGLDVLYLTRPPGGSVGREFAKKHGGIATLTTEFAGYDRLNSREYPRKHVVLVTLPPFGTGDIVLFKENPVQILGIDEKIEFWDFKKKNQFKIPVKQFLTVKPEQLDLNFDAFQVINFEQDKTIAQIMNVLTFESHYIDAEPINHLIEGQTFEGAFYKEFFIVKKAM